jgi:hypothetical protein
VRVGDSWDNFEVDVKGGSGMFKLATLVGA